MIGIIYYARNRRNGKIYVGQTIHSLLVRKGDHLNEARNGSDVHFHRALRQSREDFEWNVLCSVEAPSSLLVKMRLDVAERMYIIRYDSKNAGYNGTFGGDGGATWLGKKHTEKTRRKMRETRKNLPKHLRIEFTGKGRIGKKHSKETKRKMREAKLGRHLSEDHKRKIGIGGKGKRHRRPSC